MREVTFTKKNSSKWTTFDSYLNQRSIDNPDKLARLYIELTDDLAYARTFYPNSKTTKYLNQLTLKAHQQLYKRKRIRKNRFIEFFKTEYPMLVFKHRKYIGLSLLILIVAALVGALSTARDDSFVRLILGDGYVNMTLKNIEEGNPMGVYADENSWSMFSWIAWNNIRVSFLAFAAGIFASVGSVYLIFTNGMMLGVFQFFFIQKGLAQTMFLTIWLHGTIEIFSIVVAGAAGLVMGNSFLFPKTRSRGTNLRRGAREGVKLVAGLIPFFIVAAFIESFITRHSEVSQVLDALIIGISLLAIIFYFVVYPFIVSKKTGNEYHSTD